MITHSESIAKLAADACKALGALTNPIKDATAQISAGRAYHYVQLSSLTDHCRPTLAKHNLTVSQHLTGEPGVLRVTTILLHASGEYLSSDAVLALPTGCTPQQLGSATTYLRRYGYQAVLGIAAEDDDDGASASQTPHAAPQAQAKPQPSAPAQSVPTPPPDVPRAIPTQTFTSSVTDVQTKSGERDGRPWTKFGMTFDNGQKAGTFDAKFGQAAQTVAGTGQLCRVEIKTAKDPRYFDIIGFSVIGEDEGLEF